jgi:50S ribosomal protein L16 3-hydroxylase
MINNLSGIVDTRRFLSQFWQKKPMFARGALPRLDGAIDRACLIELACRDDVESRLVTGARKSWRLEHGPFRRRDFARLPPRGWTLLVNGVENFVTAARDLQKHFGFVPYARHDDVMVSYAAPGGSVGPHYDSYDVFLLQGSGTRRWQISNQENLALVEGAPLKILRRFQPQREWNSQSGDLLYLPPNYAHHGVAVGECITWSLGFRAPSRQEMAGRFLDFLHDRLALGGDYRDPGLKRQRHPAAIGKTMLRQVSAMVNAIRWDQTDIARCLGEYLTEPRPNLAFGRARRMPAARFTRLAAERGVQLDLKSRMLCCGSMVFINGEAVAANAIARRILSRLADDRSLPPRTPIDRQVLELLFRWYDAGYIKVGIGDQRYVKAGPC